MKLSRDARRMERHQKTLLSDEFGIGFAGLVAERLLAAPRFVDVDFALKSPRKYFGASATRTVRPDYLMWGARTPIFIVECKGCQTSRTAVMQQLRRGMEQLPSVKISGQSAVQLVIGTFLDKKQTTVFVLDPPEEDEGELPRSDAAAAPAGDTASLMRRLADNRFEVVSAPVFIDRATHGQAIGLLRWIGQHRTAAALQESIFGVQQSDELPDIDLSVMRTNGDDFLTVSDPLAPELGYTGVRILRGIRASMIDQLRMGELPEQLRESVSDSSEDLLSSVGPLGTLLAIQGLG